MNLLGKIALVGLVAGTGATALWASPGDAYSPDAAVRQQLARSQLIRQESGADLERVVQLRESARRQRDVIRLSCINDKLVQMQPMLTVIDREQVELRGDNPSVFAQIVATGQNIQRLREDADRCGGEALLTNSESSNGFTAPVIPDNPYGQAWTLTGVEAPAYASPFN